MTMTALRHPAIIPETTRAQALAEGDLIDVTAVARKMRLLRHPVAVTRAVWEDCVHWDETIEDRKTGFSAEDTDGRLHDLVWAASVAAAERPRASATHFTMRRVPTTGKGTQSRPVTLLVHVGPGDRGEPVVTIMSPTEA